MCITNIPGQSGETKVDISLGQLHIDSFETSIPLTFFVNLHFQTEGVPFNISQLE